MFGLGPWELIFILVIVIFVYGGKRLAGVGENLGKSIAEFKKAVRDYPPSIADKQKKLSEERKKNKPHSESSTKG